MRLCIFLLGVAVPLCAQNPVTDTLRTGYSRMKQNLIETAEVMPEADYSFKLTPPQREFSGWLEHTAMSAYGSCAQMIGAAPPDAMKSVHGLTKKADVSRALKESFDYCDAAFKDMTDAKATTQVTIGDRKLYPVTPMIGLVALLNEHYGNLVGYMRSKGIVPPSTARASKKK